MKRALLILVVMAAIVAGVPAQPASANPIAGSRYWGDGNYHLLDSQVGVGNMVAFWQSFEMTYNQIPCTGLDGVYGAQSRAGTKNLQAFFGLTADGIVGKNTWNAGSHWLHYVGSDGYITTFWAPNYPSGTYFPLYFYVYGGLWTWEVPNVTDPFEAQFGTNHPAVTFGTTC